LTNILSKNIKDLSPSITNTTSKRSKEIEVFVEFDDIKTIEDITASTISFFVDAMIQKLRSQ